MSIALALVAAAASLSAPPLELAPGISHDPAVPTLEGVIGHDFGAEITHPRDIVRYLEALAAAAPERTRLIHYAESWEGRPLVVLAVASAERLAQLDAVKAGLERLADPRGLDEAEAERLVSELPVVTWLIHGVHGNEISSSDAALALAWHLLAAQDDPRVDAVLAESVVLIDPSENPDGRARFLAWNVAARAADPDPAPWSAEHDEAWPGGRANHYLFDLNRDWFALTQPETRGRVALALEWRPHVMADLHEMRGESTYYFAPPADPINPQVTRTQLDWLEALGRANAEAFDQRGFAWFVREVYDSFYPGYGESWPVLNGAIGATFEQASPRGLIYRRRGDGQLLHYRDAIVHHFTAALTTAATAAGHREQLLRDYLAYRRSAIDSARGGPRAWLIPPGHDPAASARLARLLAAQGIEVVRAEEPLRLGSEQLPAGTWVAPLAQPSSRLLRSLMEPDVPMDEDFVAEQERRRRKRLRLQIYDITGWSLPALFDVEVRTAESDPLGRTAPVSGESEAAPLSLDEARVGYLMPWGTGTAAVVVEALQEGLLVRRAGRPLTIGGRDFAEGAVLLRTADNPADLRERLGRLAGRHGAEVVAVDSAWVDSGMSLGSNDVRALRRPRVLLAWAAPTRSVSAGWARYVLERRYAQPVTAVRVESLGNVPLHEYDVLVLPEGDYRNALNDRQLGRLKGWLQAGGTLVTLGEASRWAAREEVGLLATPTQLRDGRPERGEDDEKGEAAEPAEDQELEQAIAPLRERPDEVPGALLRVRLDREHWLSSGSDGELQAVVEGRRVFAPIRLDKGRNVGVYAEPEQLVASGLVWEDSKQLLGEKAWLMHQPVGQGHLIAFAEDPNYRAFAEATQLVFLNAVLLAPSY